MPELPEVEATRQSFAEAIRGSTVLDVRLGKPLRWPLGCAPESLRGRRVLGVRRRGKYLLIDLSEGLLLLHLGMSGSVRFAPALPPGGPHDHVELVTSQGILRLNDPRRFGALVYAEHEQADPAVKLLQGLGVEPLGGDFDAKTFHAAMRGRRVSIKQLLLGGQVVVGVGNIYASEALFLAGIRPSLPAQRLSLPRAQRLRAAIVEVLSRALAAGGSTLRNYSSAVGEAGRFQQQVAVYGRAGQPCVRCTTPIRLLRQGQRSTFYCPRCQRA